MALLNYLVDTGINVISGINISVFENKIPITGQMIQQVYINVTSATVSNNDIVICTDVSYAISSYVIATNNDLLNNNITLGNYYSVGIISDNSNKNFILNNSFIGNGSALGIVDTSPLIMLLVEIILLMLQLQSISLIIIQF